MRLLHFNEQNKLICTNFTGKTISPYAILSHRWGDSEVLYGHVVNGNYQVDGNGYQKIEFCARQAAQDGLDYFWIDTCCIDKHDRRELSRSINSMFDWYKAASKCYVYLWDVSFSTTAGAESQRGWETSFRESRWHTRGWTLQELIAPSSVEFFSSEGRCLGDRKGLAYILNEITGIPVNVLQGSSTNPIDISSCEVWSAKRTTTEPEDSVYCLLGMLGVRMPLCYGEGKNEAMQRRLRALQKDGAPNTIPFSRNERFVGRESELSQLDAALAAGVHMIGIVGEGGIGKTQLAVEVAYRFREERPSCAVLWIDAGDSDSFYLGCSQIAQACSIVGWDDEQADVRQLVKAHLEQEELGRWLLLLDNVDGAMIDSRPLFTYMPQSSQGSIVFVSDERTAVKQPTPDPLTLIELHRMAANTALEMTRRHIPGPIQKAMQDEMILLIHDLSYHPLAIVQALDYINTTNTSLEQYRKYLANERILLGIRQLDAHPVATTITISLRRLHVEDPFAVTALCIAACVDRHDIPVDLFGKEMDDRSSSDVIGTLEEYALVHRRPGDCSFDIPQLVHSALRQKMQDRMNYERYVEQATNRLCTIYFHSGPGTMSSYRRLMTHAKQVLSRWAADNKSLAKMSLALRCAAALDSGGRCQEAEHLYVRTIEASARMFGKEHPDILCTMVRFAATSYKVQGRCQPAEGLLVPFVVVEKSLRTLGPEHPVTLIRLHGLAILCLDQERRKNLEEHARQEFETLFSRVLDGEPSESLRDRTQLAAISMKQGRMQEAENLVVQALKMHTKMLGEEHPDVLAAMNMIASIWKAMGRDGKSLVFMTEVVRLRKQLQGEHHPLTIGRTECLSKWTAERRESKGS